MASQWTPERVELLSSLWADGVPGGVIAKRLGPGFTRGMIAGKRHSLGLPPRGELAAKAAQARNGRRTAEMLGHVGKANPAVEAAAEAAVLVLEAMMAPLQGSSPRPWELRRWGECAFPVAGYGAGTLSCCEVTDRGSPYCVGHREMLAGRPWPPVDEAPALSQWANA
jgi:hypothetical protein